MGSIMGPRTAWVIPGIHETCSLLIVFSVNDIGEPLASSAVRPQGHGQAGHRDLARVVVDVKKAGTRRDSGRRSLTDSGEVERR
jgi:hypothetical protein